MGGGVLKCHACWCGGCAFLFSSSHFLGDVLINRIELLGAKRNASKIIRYTPYHRRRIACVYYMHIHIYTTTLRDTVQGEIDMIENLEKPTAFFGTGRSVDTVDGHGFSMRHEWLK